MQKGSEGIPESGDMSMESGINPHFILALVMTLIVPVIVMPYLTDNAFNTPKTLVLLIGVSLMVFIYGFCLLRGRSVLKPETPTFKIILFLIILNFFSFFYTKNIYFTSIAAVLNIICLLFFYFISLYTNEKMAFILIIAIAFSGLLVSIIVWLQFFEIYILIRWAERGGMIMGTIGNSNYLGAYLIFPLFTMAGLIFLLKGNLRLVPTGLFILIMGAFLFARARSSWIGFFIALPVFIFIARGIAGIAWLRFSRVALFCIPALLMLALIWQVTPEKYKSNRVAFAKVFDITSLKYRFTGYIPPAIELWKQSPLFGTGLWSYRNLVYEAQAKINKRTGVFFNDYSNPKPRRAHNEYLEILNDGGLLAAGALFLFFVVIMAHGWEVIKDEEVSYQDRVITAVCFCSTIAIMLTALFFFPFRLNSTMFMTVLMMGLMEGAYLRNRGLISRIGGLGSKAGNILIPLLFMFLVGTVWYAGIRPLKGEMEHFRYRKSLSQGDRGGAERHILKAIDYNPRNSPYHLYASQLYLNHFKDYGKAGDYIERAITDFNGDITMWSAYFLKGLIKFRVGSLLEARVAFEKALYYNPNFEPAKQKLAEVNKVLEKHDSVMIKFK
ncbi:O-antigen ligase family protein [Thermodesulfobacteriota bacterium]